MTSPTKPPLNESEVTGAEDAAAADQMIDEALTTPADHLKRLCAMETLDRIGYLQRLSMEHLRALAKLVNFDSSGRSASSIRLGIIGHITVVAVGMNLTIPEVAARGRRLPPSQPKHCPFCGGMNIVFVNMWSAKSMEPHDDGNVADLDEHQCRDCDNRSFWT